MSKIKKPIDVKSIEVKLYFPEEYCDEDADLMEEKARQYGLNPEIKGLTCEEAKFHPAMPYFSTDYGTYGSFEALLKGFKEKGIILKIKQKRR